MPNALAMIGNIAISGALAVGAGGLLPAASAVQIGFGIFGAALSTSAGATTCQPKRTRP